MVKNLSRARKVWSRMLCIFRREGGAMWVSGLFFKAMVQAVPLFRAEAWVITPRMGKSLGGGSDPSGDMADCTSPAEDTG